MALTAIEYAFATDVVAVAARLPVREGGWGLLFCEDDRGLRYTLAGDADYLRLLLDIHPGSVPGTTGPRDVKHLLNDELPPEAFPLKRRGWPDAWTQKDYRGDAWNDRT